MKEQLITFETAKLTKEKGFSEFTYTVYNENGKSFVFNSGFLSRATRIPAPTQSLLQKWLREKHNIVVWLKPYHAELNGYYSDNWSVYIDDSHGRHLITDYIYVHGYEKALEKGLQEALKLIEL